MVMDARLPCHPLYTKALPSWTQPKSLPPKDRHDDISVTLGHGDVGAEVCPGAIPEQEP